MANTTRTIYKVAVNKYSYLAPSGYSKYYERLTKTQFTSEEAYGYAQAKEHAQEYLKRNIGTDEVIEIIKETITTEVVEEVSTDDRVQYRGIWFSKDTPADLITKLVNIMETHTKVTITYDNSMLSTDVGYLDCTTESKPTLVLLDSFNSLGSRLNAVPTDKIVSIKRTQGIIPIYNRVDPEAAPVFPEGSIVVR